MIEDRPGAIITQKPKATKIVSEVVTFSVELA